MSRNTFVWFFIGILAIGALGVGAYFYFFTGVFGGPGGTNGTKTSVGGFLPFGSSSSGSGIFSSENTLNNVPSTAGQNQNQPAAQLLKLVQNPVAGFIPTTLGSTTIVRYMEKETGHTFDIDMSIPASRTRISNSTIPRIYQALFGTNGASVIMRYLDSDGLIQTYYSSIPQATSTADIQGGVELKGSFLTRNIDDISVSPPATKIFSIVNSSDGSVGTVSDLNGGKKAQIFNSPFGEWLSSWANEKTILLTTKPSSVAAGYAYSLDTNSGSSQKIYGGTKGLTALLSQDGKKLLVSEISAGVPSLKIYTLSTRGLNDTGLRTITDKCVWASSRTVYCAVPQYVPAAAAGYPDAWYQGVVSFSDSIWKIDVDSISTDVVSPVSQRSGEGIDAVNLTLDKNAGYIFFINKTDNSLWSLRIQ